MKRQRAIGVVAWAAILASVGAASWRGGRGPGRIELDFGPGDSPYVEGFVPFYEVEGRERTHWTTYDARVELPVALRGGPVTVAYRYARDFPQTAEVEVALAGQPIDRFSARGGAFVERTVELAAVDEPRLVLAILSDSHERRNMGLKLDWVRFDYGERASLRVAGAAVWKPLLLTLLCLVGLRLLGWSMWSSALLCAAPGVFLTVSLLSDPWLVHRFLTGVPLATAIYLAVGLGAGWALVKWTSVSDLSRRRVTTLAFGAFLVRAVLVSHPDFYYPDLRTHATLVGVLESAGLDFLRSPATYIETHGKWVTEAYGRTYAFPYTPAFHLGFAVLRLSYDGVITAMKLGAAAISTVPIVFVWAMGRWLGVSVLGSLLMALVPTYTSRLSFAFLPSLFGHAFDIGLLLWLLMNIERLGTTKRWLLGAALVALSQLAYVSGVLNLSVLLGVLVVVELARRGDGGLARAKGAALMLALGSAASFAIFYRDFLPMVSDVVARAASGASGAESRYAVRGFLGVLYERTRGFFGFVYPLLAAVGLVSLRRGARHGAAWPVLLAWALAYLALILGRAKMPDLFTHGHETLFVTPLVCLLAGAVLGRLWEQGGARRAASVALIVFLAGQGLWLQWQAIAAQLY